MINCLFFLLTDAGMAPGGNFGVIMDKLFFHLARILPIGGLYQERVLEL